MCALSKVYNQSFIWIIYLVFITGAYTFLHWFLAVPLLYSYLFEWRSQKWSGDLLVWFLVLSFACWLVISILIVLVWFCLRLHNARHLNESNGKLTKESTDVQGEKTQSVKTVYSEKSDITPTESGKEIVTLPDFSPTENFAVLKVTEPQPKQSSVLSLDFPIPVEETWLYIQKESPPLVEDETKGKPPKTPREIFFKDLIEGAPKSSSYFNFDSEQISPNPEENDLKDKDEDDEKKEKSYFLGSQTEKKNLTSEVLIILNEKGVLTEKLGNDKF